MESRKKVIIDKLTKYLDDVGKSGESSAEFLALYHNLMKDHRWKYYAAVKGVLPYVGNLINKEIEQLTRLEENTLNSDLSQGLPNFMLFLLLFSSAKPVPMNSEIMFYLLFFNTYRNLYTISHTVIKTQGRK